jgi:hypothetical protein
VLHPPVELARVFGKLPINGFGKRMKLPKIPLYGYIRSDELVDKSLQ